MRNAPVALLLLGLMGGLASAQPAQPLFRASAETYACSNPRATRALANSQDPRQTDPGWVNFVVTDGKCVVITPRSQWRLVFREGDLAFVTYAGTIGAPGSFYVSSAVLVPIPATPPANSPPISDPAPVSPPPAVSAAPPPRPAPESAQTPDVKPAAPPPPPSVPVPADTSPIAPPQPSAPPSSAPAAVSPAPSGGNPASGQSGSGVPVAIAVGAGLVWLVRRSLKRVPAGKTTARASKARTEPTWAATPSRPRPAAKVAPTASPPVAKALPAAWIPAGQAVSVAGHAILGGMVYVGGPHVRENLAPCFIDPSLPVASSGPALTGQGMPYWPSYSLVGPNCRLAYLCWLASGRSDPATYIGYVFLFFYGLERRVFVDGADTAETAAIVAEVRRLLAIHGGNASFGRYAGDFIAAVELRSLIGDGSAVGSYQPALDGPAHAMPLGLKLAIATRVAKGQPLPFELAMAGLFGLRADLLPFDGRVLEHVRPQLLGLARPRFEEACPLGFKLGNRKDSRLDLTHRCATAGLTVNLAATSGNEGLPDPATLTWNKLVNLVAPLAAQLETLARLKAQHPERMDSLSVFAALPDGVPASVAGPGAMDARGWLEALPKPISRVAFADLAEKALGGRREKWTLRQHRAVCDALAATSYGLEPHPEDGSVPIADDTAMFVFPDSGARSERSAPFATAAIGAELAAAVAGVDAATGPSVKERWLSGVAHRLQIADAELVRLDARMRWLEGTKPTVARVKVKLQEASAGDRETVAWLAASAAAAAGAVARGQVALLEKVYDDLGLRRGALYSAMHAAAAREGAPAPVPAPLSVTALAPEIGRPAAPGQGAGSVRLPATPPVAAKAAPATEPVPVAKGTAEVVHRIPPPPGGPAKAGTAGATLDGAVKPEADALPATSPGAADPGKVPAPATPPAAGRTDAKAPAGSTPHAPATTGMLDPERVKAIKAETDRVSSVLAGIFVEDEPVPAKAAAAETTATAFPGLDASHAALLGVLAGAANWSRGDFEREAGVRGLLPDGALETINEWAYDRFGAPALDEGDGIAVDVALLADTGMTADAD